MCPISKEKMKDRIVKAIKSNPVLFIFYIGMMVSILATFVITPLMLLPVLFFFGGLIYDLISFYLKERKTVTHLEGERQS